MRADGAARDFGWPLGVTQGESPQRALTEEQQRGRAKDRPYLAWTTPNAAAGIYEMASTHHWFVTLVTGVTAEKAPAGGKKLDAG